MGMFSWMRLGSAVTPQPGDDLPITIVVNPDGTAVGSSSGATVARAIRAEGTKIISAASAAQTADNAAPIVNANAVQLMAADAGRNRTRVQNLGTATLFLRINPTGDTTPAFVPAASGAGSAQLKAVIALPAGGVWESPVDEDCKGPVSVCSATANVTVSYQAS